MVDAQADGGEDPVAVLADRLAELDERREPAAGEARQEPVDQHGDVVDVQAGLEDAADGFLERVGAPDLAAGGLQSGERGRLRVGELLGLLEQRPAGVLEALGGVLVAELGEFVPGAAAWTLVQRLVGRLHDVIRVDADGLRPAGAAPADGTWRSCWSCPSRRPAARRHARRSRFHLAAVLERRALDAVAGRDDGARADGTMIAGSGAWAACGARVLAAGAAGRARRRRRRRGPGPSFASPHHLAALMVGDEGEVVVLALPADLVHADVIEIVESVGVELVVADALDDPPDRVPVDPQHRLIVDLSVHVASHATRHSKSRVNSEPGGRTACLGPRPVHGAPQAPAAAVDLQPPDPEIQVPPDRVLRARVLARRRRSRTPGRPAGGGKAPPRRSPCRARRTFRTHTPSTRRSREMPT